MCQACELSTHLGVMLAANQRCDAAESKWKLKRRAFLKSALVCAGASLSQSLTVMKPGTASAENMPSTAKTVFYNGAVYTVAPAQPWAQALAVGGGRILAVGSNVEMKSFIGPQTEVIDLGGRMLLPGFVEGHTHPFLGSFFTAGVDLQYPTRQEALAAIKEFASNNPEGTLRGFGWRMDMFSDSGPTRQMLDAIVPDRPVLMFAIDCHSLWCNTAALKKAGITKNTPDPVPGFSYFARDKDGEATGFVLEVAAILQLVNAVAPLTLTAMKAMLGEWLPRASAAGITALFDAGVPPIGGTEADIIQIYSDYEAAGKLPFRVVTCHSVKAPPIESAVRDTVELSQRFRSALVQARVLKIVADGTEEGWTAYMLEPYTDKPGFRGIPPFSSEQMKTMIRQADEAGIDVHVHACGDATVRMALDAIEDVIKTRPSRERRNTIAHNVIVDDTDIPRFAQLGVISEFSINWHSMDPDTVDILSARCGPERQSRIYRPRSILKTGGKISAGTDWPAAGYFSTFKPLEAIQIGVTRQLLDRSADQVCLEPADERLDLAEAIAANTIGAAYQLRMEDHIGTLEVGKLADVVVLEKNLFALPANDISRTPISMTMLNGSFTYRAS